jgi:type IV secretory pathway TrbL component
MFGTLKWSMIFGVICYILAFLLYLIDKRNSVLAFFIRLLAFVGFVALAFAAFYAIVTS